MPLVYTSEDLRYLQFIIQNKETNAGTKENVPHAAITNFIHLGTRMMDLEMWLRKQFDITGSKSVFGVVPADELYSPPIPFYMINTIVARLLESYEEERTPVLHFVLVVKDTCFVNQPIPIPPFDSPFHPIHVEQLDINANFMMRAKAMNKLVQNLSEHGFVRLEVSDEMAGAIQSAYTMTRKWLVQQRLLPKEKQWRDLVNAKKYQCEDTIEAHVHVRDHPLVSRGRYVGYSSDCSRDYIQLRHPIHKSGTKWPHEYFNQTESGYKYAMQMLKLLHRLDELARICLIAICETMKLDKEYIVAELLDDVSRPVDQVAEYDINKAYQYGASVLRIYEYRNKNLVSDTNTTLVGDDSCGVHADLGLLTISPTASTAGLQIWSLERMLWTNIEAGAGAKHVSLFAGETLGFLTNGRIPGALHRVPAIHGIDGDERRMSMPYFLRTRPEKVMNPTKSPALHLTCRDFMEDIVFKKRPWRRFPKANQSPPDY